eukprot:jgi/Mesvir1/4677/Mv16841-RA.2
MERKRMEEELQAMAARVAFLKVEDSKVDKVIAETKSLAQKVKHERERIAGGSPEPAPGGAAAAASKLKKPTTPSTKLPARRASSASLPSASAPKPASARIARSNSHVDRVASRPTSGTATRDAAGALPAATRSPCAEDARLETGPGSEGGKAGEEDRSQAQGVAAASGATSGGDKRGEREEEWTLEDDEDHPSEVVDVRIHPDSNQGSEDHGRQGRHGLSPLADEHYSGDDFEEVDVAEEADAREEGTVAEVAGQRSGRVGGKKEEAAGAKEEPKDDDDDRFANGSITYEVGVGAWA